MHCQYTSLPSFCYSFYSSFLQPSPKQRDKPVGSYHHTRSRSLLPSTPRPVPFPPCNCADTSTVCLERNAEVWGKAVTMRGCSTPCTIPQGPPVVERCPRAEQSWKIHHVLVGQQHPVNIPVLPPCSIFNNVRYSQQEGVIGRCRKRDRELSSGVLEGGMVS